jgi:hypothetical protein
LKQTDNLTVKTRPTQLLEEKVRQVLVGGYWLVAKVRGQVLNKGIGRYLNENEALIKV